MRAISSMQAECLVCWEITEEFNVLGGLFPQPILEQQYCLQGEAAHVPFSMSVYNLVRLLGRPFRSLTSLGPPGQCLLQGARAGCTKPRRSAAERFVALQP